jgi:hypothetical protein
MSKNWTANPGIGYQAREAHAALVAAQPVDQAAIDGLLAQLAGATGAQLVNVEIGLGNDTDDGHPPFGLNEATARELIRQIEALRLSARG